MTRNRTCLFAVSILLVSLFAAVGANAAEETGNAATESATEIFKWINFAFLIIAVIWAWDRWATPGLRRARDRVGSAIAGAAVAKAAADAQLREAESRLVNLQKEVAELRTFAEKEAVAERERLRAATQNDVQKIAAATKAEIEAAERAARLELKALAANLAVDGAGTLLAKQLTPRAQESLISHFVKSLEGRPN
jgi:F-type H+-transporting ATPase subunit b